MTIYRFAHRRYAKDLSGEGARLFGGRWNQPGVAALYASEHISLALLEVLVNAGTLDDLQQLRLMELDLPDVAIAEILPPKQLKKDWYTDIAYTQWLGTEMLNAQASLVIRCPSAVVQREFNYIINPRHKDFKKLKLADSSAFRFDERLFKTI